MRRRWRRWRRKKVEVGQKEQGRGSEKSRCKAVNMDIRIILWNWI